jgi:hypothetical protein
MHRAGGERTQARAGKQSVRGKCRHVVCDKGQMAELGLQLQRQYHVVDIA